MIIYSALNTRTGKSYVGQTIRTLEKRKYEHLRLAQQVARRKHTMPIHFSIRETGSAYFEWSILETCTSIEQLNEREKFYIKLLNTIVPYEYNQTQGGALDIKNSQEVRAWLQEKLKKAA